MNNQRRKDIKKVIQEIEKLVSEILRDEEFSYDNMPDNLQGSQIGCDSEDAQELLQEVIDLLEEAVSCLEDIA